MDDLHERVRQHAYRLWMEEGCPEGRSDVHWEKARELVAIEDNQKLTTKPAPHTRGEPIEPIEAVENAGEFPTLTDQGEQQAPKRAAAPRAKVQAKPAVRPKAAAPARKKAEDPAPPKTGRAGKIR